MAARTAAARNKSEIKNLKSETPKRSPLELDRLIHERLRLGIVSALAVNDRLTFNDLKGLLQTTDGNLSVHARKLEEEMRRRARVSLIGEVTGLSRSKAQAYFELRDAEACGLPPAPSTGVRLKKANSR